MSEQQMPARIWAHDESSTVQHRGWWTTRTENNEIEFVQAYIAEAMADALENARLQIEYLHSKYEPTGSGESVLAHIRSALSAFKDSAQDRGAS